MYVVGAWDPTSRVCTRAAKRLLLRSRTRSVDSSTVVKKKNAMTRPRIMMSLLRPRSSVAFKGSLMHWSVIEEAKPRMKEDCASMQMLRPAGVEPTVPASEANTLTITLHMFATPMLMPLLNIHAETALCAGEKASLSGFAQLAPARQVDDAPTVPAGGGFLRPR